MERSSTHAGVVPLNCTWASSSSVFLALSCRTRAHPEGGLGWKGHDLYVTDTAVPYVQDNEGGKEFEEKSKDGHVYTSLVSYETARRPCSSSRKQCETEVICPILALAKLHRLRTGEKRSSFAVAENLRRTSSALPSRAHWKIPVRVSICSRGVERGTRDLQLTLEKLVLRCRFGTIHPFACLDRACLCLEPGAYSLRLDHWPQWRLSGGSEGANHPGTTMSFAFLTC